MTHLDTVTAPVPELSIVMPCLNEADTLAMCIDKAHRALRDAGIDGEVVIADNGSTDGSHEDRRARTAPASCRSPLRGYGSALMGGIEAARGRYVIMGDADDSYDFLEVPKFVEQLRQATGSCRDAGCRAAAARVLPGRDAAARIAGSAIPRSRSWRAGGSGRRCTTSTAACAASRMEAVPPARLRCTGMEFATEMIIKASLYGERIAEVPITLHPDGRKAHPPHLRTFRDGWRTLRLFLLFSPRWLFLVPGAALIAARRCRLCGRAAGRPVGGVTFDVHTLLFASLALLGGQQAIAFALFAKTFAIGEGLLPLDRARRASSRSPRSSGGCCSAAPRWSPASGCWARWRCSGGGRAWVRSTTRARCGWRFQARR